MKASEWAFDRIKEAVRLGSTGRGREDEHCVRDHAQKYGLSAASHCARWRTRWSHNVALVPKLQQLPSARLRLVGLWVKIHKLVVRDLWRKVRLEATKQAFGRANW